ncbi:hypothetical protein HNQ08_003283 [Deinococcus humi]|uniref:Uncharacterized protein n=1 Tax=Deinococcus humi TaxID=662880 RepID=A0A7W8JVU7_9DEIO|nr:hypothetical protein [Deinococcus humi]
MTHPPAPLGQVTALSTPLAAHDDDALTALSNLLLILNER